MVMTGWLHMVLRYKGATEGIKMFINGFLEGSDSSGSSLNVRSTNGRVCIGRRFSFEDERYCSCAVYDLY